MVHELGANAVYEKMKQEMRIWVLKVFPVVSENQPVQMLLF